MVCPTFTPTPYYCEENVWQLCTDPQVRATHRAAIVISNRSRTVAITHQRAAPDPTTPAIWDYHVILAAHDPTGWTIWDVDSTLGLAVPLSIYLRASFDFPQGVDEPFAARFRVVPADRYRETLASDRSHMRDERGSYRMPPPPWPMIGRGTNLMRFVDMEEIFEGEVVELAELPAALARLVVDG